MTVQEIVDFCKEKKLEFSLEDAKKWLEEHKELAEAKIEDLAKAFTTSGELDDSALDEVSGGLGYLTGGSSTVTSRLNGAASFLTTNSSLTGVKKIASGSAVVMRVTDANQEK